MTIDTRDTKGNSICYVFHSYKNTSRRQKRKRTTTILAD